MRGTIHSITSGLLAGKKYQNISPNKLVLSLERKLKELTVLYEISQVIGTALNCHEVFSDRECRVTAGLNSTRLQKHPFPGKLANREFIIGLNQKKFKGEKK